MICRMTAATNRETQTRKSVPLTVRHLADLDMVRRSPEAQRTVGITCDGMSDATSCTPWSPTVSSTPVTPSGKRPTLP